MMFRTKWSLLAVALAGIPLAGQTQVDLHTQSKGIDFQGAPYTRPLKASATLPSTCSVNDMLLLTTAPAGANIYACLSPNTWSGEGGGVSLLTVQNGGSIVGTRGNLNFVPGTGLVNVITDLGNAINVQQAIDTALVVSKPSLQAGETVMCQSASGSGAAYTCSMNPTLTAYTAGMIIAWLPDRNGSSGATTLNIDTLGAKRVKEWDGATDPGISDIVTSKPMLLWYDGAVFRMLFTSASGSASLSNSIRVCSMIIGADNGPALVNADLGPKGNQCFVPFASTVIEIEVRADAGTPNIVIGRDGSGARVNLLSSALTTAPSGGQACANTGGTTGVDGTTVCAATLQNTALAAGNWLYLVNGAADGIAKRMSVAVVYATN
jgi:hypothetical protein